MSKYLNREDFRLLVCERKYKTEEELKLYLVEKLPIFLKIKPEQIKTELDTTGFSGDLAERADIVIQSDEENPHALMVIELKLDDKVRQKHGENYMIPEKQLRKYCLNLRTPYGILLTDHLCFMFHFNYFGVTSKRHPIFKIPYPADINKELGNDLFWGVILHARDFNYLTAIIFVVIYVIFLLLFKSFGH